MDEIAIVKLSTLRSKIGAIPGKLLVTLLLMEGIYWHFSWDAFQENVLESIVSTVVLYGLISYFYLCVRMTHNWLIGIIVALILFFFLMANLEKMGDILSAVITIVLCFGGPILDVYYLLRYFSLKRKLFSGAGHSYEYDDQEEDSEEDYGEYEEYEEDQGSASDSPGFFFGCGDERSIRRRYKDLCKVYHPDSGNGSAEVFAKITDEYNRLITQYTN